MSDKYINVACPVTYDGKSYPGFTVHPGVNMSLEPAGCLPGKTNIKFTNTAIRPTGIYLEGISGADISERACVGFFGIGGYLQVTNS